MYKITEEEFESMKLIMQKRDVAMFNANPQNLNMKASADQRHEWIKAVLEYQAEVNYLFQNWWDVQIKKFGLEGDYELNFETRELVKREPPKIEVEQVQ